jgi:hypothetical protein
MEILKFITVFQIALHWPLILSQINPVHIAPSYLSKIYFIILAYLLKARTVEPEK